MATDSIDRVRKIDVEKMTDQEVEKIEAAISDKINKIINQAMNDANEILNIYGMEVVFSVDLKKK